MLGFVCVYRYVWVNLCNERCCPVPVVVEDPEFTDVIENITVAAGRNVKFACSVKNLGTYKVRKDTNTYPYTPTGL